MQGGHREGGGGLGPKPPGDEGPAHQAQGGRSGKH